MGSVRAFRRAALRAGSLVSSCACDAATRARRKKQKGRQRRRPSQEAREPKLVDMPREACDPFAAPSEACAGTARSMSSLRRRWTDQESHQKRRGHKLSRGRQGFRASNALDRSRKTPSVHIHARTLVSIALAN